MAGIGALSILCPAHEPSSYQARRLYHSAHRFCCEYAAERTSAGHRARARQAAADLQVRASTCTRSCVCMHTVGLCSQAIVPPTCVSRRRNGWSRCPRAHAALCDARACACAGAGRRTGGCVGATGGRAVRRVRPCAGCTPDGALLRRVRLGGASPTADHRTAHGGYSTAECSKGNEPQPKPQPGPLQADVSRNHTLHSRPQTPRNTHTRTTDEVHRCL